MDKAGKLIQLRQRDREEVHPPITLVLSGKWEVADVEYEAEFNRTSITVYYQTDENNGT